MGTDITIHEMGQERWILLAEGNRYEFDVWDDMIGNLILRMSACLIRRTQSFLLHSASMVWNGKGVLCTAPSRVGKSTLALNAWLRGWTLVGDDLAAIDSKEQTIRAFPKALKPRLTERRLPKALSGIPKEQSLLAQLNNEYRLLIGRGLPHMAPYDQSFPLERLYLMVRDSHGPSRLERISRDDALKTMLEQVLPNHSKAPMEAVLLFKAMWSRGDLFRLHLGENDLEGALDLILPELN